MNCAQVQEYALDLVYEEIDAPSRAAVEAHLATCSRCADELQALRATLDVSREALHGPLDEAPPARIRAAVRAAAAEQLVSRPQRTGVLRWLTAPFLVPVLAGIAALAIVIADKYAPLGTPESEKSQQVEYSPPRETQLAPSDLALRAPPPAAPARAPVAAKRASPAPRMRPTDAAESKSSAVRTRAAARQMRDHNVAHDVAAPPVREDSAPTGGGEHAVAKRRYARPPARSLGAREESSVLDEAEASDTPLAGAPTPEALREPEPSPTASAAFEPPAAASASASAPNSAPASVTGARSATRASGARGQSAGRSEYAARSAAPEKSLPLTTRIERAELAFKRARYREAAEAYRLLLRDHPRHPDANAWRIRMREATEALAP